MQVEAVTPHKNGKKPAAPVADENGVIPDIDQVLYLADKMIAAGEDPWELLAAAAEREEDDADKHRWNQCDLASKVQKQYGENSIAAFARDAKLPVRRAKEYRTMGTFYQRSARADFLAEHQTLTYTHLRTATRLKSVESAWRFLDRADLRGWSSDKCEYVIGRMQRIYRKSEPPTVGDAPMPTEPLVRPVTDIFEVRSIIVAKEGRCTFIVPDADTIAQLKHDHPLAEITINVNYEVPIEDQS